MREEEWKRRPSILSDLASTARAAYQVLQVVARSAFSAAVPEILEAYARSKPPDLVRLITRGDDQPYFYRVYIKDEKISEDGASEDDLFNIFLHKFVGSDPLEEVHTHPWRWWVSIILSGSYRQVRYEWSPAVIEDGRVRRVALSDKSERTFGPLDVNIILHSQAHRVELTPGQPCWTLFIHGPRVSTWAFANESTGLLREITKRVRKDNPSVPID
jgi:hypothetical protein